MNNNKINDNIEQPTALPDKVEDTANVSSTSNPVIDKEEVDSYGKFKTVQELKNAYEHLEQEFTRKSQKLKELESKLQVKADEDKWAEKVKNLHEKYPISRSLGEEITTYIKENNGLIAREDCLESALLHVLATKFELNGTKSTPKSRDNIPRVISSSGAMSVAPHVTPLTVKEANALATEQLKRVSKKD